tara:strand:+ start:754 stop:1266 length:513 start_codon:yes stop_codon:yes gene_type:complete
MKRKFEEETVETPVEEVQEESTPDSHEQFINILVDMGLSAEQAEAVHEMAMNLAQGSSEEVTEETKVEASRSRREEFARRKKRRGYSRRKMSEERGEGRPARRTEMSREEMRMRRLSRQNRMLRQQLQELGQQPAANPVRNRPQAKAEQPTISAEGTAKSRVFGYFKDMI